MFCFLDPERLIPVTVTRAPPQSPFLVVFLEGGRGRGGAIKHRRYSRFPFSSAAFASIFEESSTPHPMSSTVACSRLPRRRSVSSAELQKHLGVCADVRTHVRVAEDVRSTSLGIAVTNVRALIVRQMSCPMCASSVSRDVVEHGDETRPGKNKKQKQARGGDVL